MVQLLEKTLIRVGNEEYVRQNGSYGLTTLRNRHAHISGANLHLKFRGKSGVRHEIMIQDEQLARIVKRCQELPGQELFQYVDTEGPRTVSSCDVNEYIRIACGNEYTAKDFRTWSGTVLAARALSACEPAAIAAHAKRNIVRAVEYVAKHLGNTPAVCRNSYVHPAIIEAYLDGTLHESLALRRRRASDRAIRSVDEAKVLAFLKRRFRRGLA